MYRKVTVIGLGTLGGFLCKHISEFETVKELVIIDHDTVESRNVFRSIYNPQDIGEYKVDALADMIRENVGDDITVKKINTKYTEGITKLPKSDLVIDCRDIVCDRIGEINVRFYISHKTLVIDCRKHVKNPCVYNGSYSINLTKNEINKAAFYAAHSIASGHLDKMTKNNLIQRIDLDIVSSVMTKSINESIENKIDMIYEMNGAERLQSVENFIQPILNLNKTQEVEIIVGDHETKELEKLFTTMPTIINENLMALVPQNSLNTSTDVMKALTELVKKQPGVSNFVIIMRKHNGKKYIELLEETGAA